MTDFVDQRTCIKLCLRNEYSCADTLKMLRKMFGDQTMAQKNVYKWYNKFKAGRERVEDEPRSGRPSTSTDEGHVQKIKDLVLENRQLTIRDLADSVGISFGSAQTILKNVLCLKLVKSPQNSNSTTAGDNRRNDNGPSSNARGNTRGDNGSSSNDRRGHKRKKEDDDNGDDDRPPPACRCGVPAKRLTARKEGPNCGREFFVCPNEPNQCSFYMWADEVADNVMCSCQMSARRMTVKKEGPNQGRPFFACSKNHTDADRCEFFLWADEEGEQRSRGGSGSSSSRGRPGSSRGGSTSARGGVKAPRTTQNFRARGNTDGGTTKVRKCGLCGQPGHTRRNCPQSGD